MISILFFSACKKDSVSDNNDNLNPPSANAGLVQYIEAPVNTSTLTGSGSSENGPIVGNLWSLVSGPIVISTNKVSINLS